MDKEKPVYEFIRSIPVYKLLKMSSKKLDRLEKNIKREMYRAEIALRWIKGIKKLKRQKNGGRNG